METTIVQNFFKLYSIILKCGRPCCCPWFWSSTLVRSEVCVWEKTPAMRCSLRQSPQVIRKAIECADTSGHSQLNRPQRQLLFSLLKFSGEEKHKHKGTIHILFLLLFHKPSVLSLSIWVYCISVGAKACASAWVCIWRIEFLLLRLIPISNAVLLPRQTSASIFTQQLTRPTSTPTPPPCVGLVPLEDFNSVWVFGMYHWLQSRGVHHVQCCAPASGGFKTNTKITWTDADGSTDDMNIGLPV